MPWSVNPSTGDLEAITGVSAPSIPTVFQTDSGSATAAANILNIVTPGSGTEGIATSASGNTVTITVSSNDLSGTITTVGAVTGDIITYDLASTPGTYTFDCKISGYDAISMLAAGYTIVGSIRTTGAAGVLIAGQAVDSFEEGALGAGSANLVVSGNNAIFRVTGTAGETVNWKAIAEFVFVS